MTHAIAGIGAIADRYTAFIVDLWGVLHDGVAPYPGAIDALALLRGRDVLLLSNAPRRAAAARDSLRALGFEDALYTGLLTSGEAAHALLAARTDPRFLGPRVHHLGPLRDRSVLDGLDLMLAPPERAHFVLNTGPDDERDPTVIDPYLPELDACLRAGLPMLCANPDLTVIRGGQQILCAGTLAAWYEAAGGEVLSLGKPYPAIYRTALDLLGNPAGKVLAIGDSLRTDIAGAKAAGLDSLWVLGGLHAEALRDETPASLAARYGAAPTWRIDRLVP